MGHSPNTRFFIYSAIGFGLPLLLCTVALLVDRLATMYGHDSLAYRIRPGFGEDSCWFTECSMSLEVFLYGPIVVSLAINLAHFTFSAWKLSKMQTQIRETRR